jgi:TetR/AcrR family transcriptional regulator, cholesterol catabolism regulator
VESTAGSASTDGVELDSKAARTRRRLLDVTASVLARKGFAGTRLSDIAKEARVQAPAIYHYFASREELIEEVVYTGAVDMRSYVSGVLAELPSDVPPAARIAAAIEAHLRLELELSDYSRALIRNVNQLPSHVGERALKEITAYGDVWRGLISDLKDAGQLREGLDHSARMIVLGALYWSVEWWNPERGNLDEVIAAAQSMILHALCP